jgi:hypothetical protein
MGLCGNFVRDLAELKRRGAMDGIASVMEVGGANRIFWESLGFRFAALDFDGHRDSTAIDLNKDTVPRRL